MYPIYPVFGTVQRKAPRKIVFNLACVETRGSDATSRQISTTSRISNKSDHTANYIIGAYYSFYRTSAYDKRVSLLGIWDEQYSIIK